MYCYRTPGVGRAAASDLPLSTILDFVDSNAGDGTVLSIADCVTNLLFPWLANFVGFDTGIALANTSAVDAALGTDAGATPQNGTCTMTGWAAADGATVTMTTPVVNAGMTMTMVLSSTPAFAGFVGYAITVCNFLNAHGFAFLTDSSGNAQGYLALVIPSGTRIAPTGEGLNQ